MKIIRKINGKKTRLYTCWVNIRQRCKNKDDPYYGKRGITVCKAWSSFDTFAKWALSHGYSDNLTIDRIDNDKGYCPSNCRWVTLQQQAVNRRTPITNTTGYIGICKRINGKGERYLAEIVRHGKHYYSPYFDTPKEAADYREYILKEVIHEK